jgi:SAM-dependent methyltransferase
MLAEAKKSLDDWIKRLEDGGDIYSFSRNPLKLPLPPDVIKEGLNKYGDFSLMNQKINTSKSSTTHQRFKEDPKEWYQYHSLYREAREEWGEIPYEVIAESIKKRPRDVIGDFGCGEAELSKLISNKVYSFDHVAINPSVIECDISKINLPDEILDVSVFSLSLMGINWKDYLKEAFRLTVPGGHLKIAEPKNRWAETKKQILLEGIKEAGFAIQGEPSDNSSRFIYVDATKPF